MGIVLIIFLTSTLLLVTLLFGYPIIIYILSKVIGKNSRKASITPAVTIVIPCYNERNVIQRKIENTFTLNYPQSKLEVILVDSASTDGTTEHIRQLSSQYRIKLVEQPNRLGKASAINEALKNVTSEIVVLTDADAFLDRDSLKNLVKNFSDPAIGAVVGRYVMSGDSGISKMIGTLFSIFKEKIRHYESNVDSASYFTGELLAFRRNLVNSIDPSIVADDQFILLVVRKRGYRCVAESASIATEKIVTSIRDHIQHRRRTTFGTLQVSAKFRDILFNLKYGIFGCLIYPMYLGRLIFIPITCLIIELSLPLLLLTLIPSTAVNLALILGVITFFSLLLLLVFNEKAGIPRSLLSIFILQIAIFMGIFDFIRGRYKTGSWQKLAKI